MPAVSRLRITSAFLPHLPSDDNLSQNQYRSNCLCSFYPLVRDFEDRVGLQVFDPALVNLEQAGPSDMELAFDFGDEQRPVDLPLGATGATDYILKRECVVFPTANQGRNSVARGVC